MTQYEAKLQELYTKDGRKPVFIENPFKIDENTPMTDILYTYNEMAPRGYLIEERLNFLEIAQRYSKKEAFNFLYPDVILSVPYEEHPSTIAMKNAVKNDVFKKCSEEEREKLWKEIERMRKEDY